MSRSLSWFDDEELRDMFAGAGAAVRSRRGIRGRSVVVASTATPPETQNQFGPSNRFTGMRDNDTGRFAPAAATKAGPPDSLPNTPEGRRARIQRVELEFDKKSTKVTAGAVLSPGEAKRSPARSVADSPEVARAAKERTSMPPLGEPTALFSPRSDASVEERVGAYLDWALKVCHARAGFVADRDGLPLAERFREGEPRPMTEELCALCAVLDRGWSMMAGITQSTPEGYAIIERGGDDGERRGWVLLAWASVAQAIEPTMKHAPRLYSALLVDTVPAQAAVTLTAQAFQSLFGGRAAR